MGLCRLARGQVCQHEEQDRRVGRICIPEGVVSANPNPVEGIERFWGDPTIIAAAVRNLGFDGDGERPLP